jgi:hypothetical protein
MTAPHDEPGLIDDGLDRSDFDDIDCGLGPDGQCDQAGTEYCDWECGRLG